MTMSCLSGYVLRAAALVVPLLVAVPASAQTSAADLVVRLERLENQIRQLTGAVEELQYRNQQLEQQLRRAGQDGGPQPPTRQTQAPPVQQIPPAPQRRSEGFEPDAYPPPPPPPPPVTGRSLGPGPSIAAAPPVPRPSGGPRRDVFDPDENPSAPGAPRSLGSGPTFVGTPAPERENHPIGAPGGRAAGAPLDLSTLSGTAAANDPVPQAPAMSGPLPPPPARNPSATGPALASVPPSAATPKDDYDLAYGYVLRKDYAQAEDAFRSFLRRYPGDRLASDAHYWLGEAMFQRQRYRDAAESFLTVTTKYETTGKAPDSLLRLGQSLAALGEREAACAALAEIGRKYPRSSVGVKQGVEREQKRVRC